MKIKLLLTLAIAFTTCYFSLAQENITKNKNSLYEFESDNRWSFGLNTQVTVGLSQDTFDSMGGTSRENLSQTGFGLGGFADYRLSEKWNLRTEFGANIDKDFNPYLSFQVEYLLNDRWSVYGGAGIYIDTTAKSLIDRDNAGRVALNPYIQLGVRYRFDQKWSMDLRFQQELSSRQKGVINNFDIGPVSTFSLGVNYKF